MHMLDTECQLTTDILALLQCLKVVPVACTALIVKLLTQSTAGIEEVPHFTGHV